MLPIEVAIYTVLGFLFALIAYTIYHYLFDRSGTEKDTLRAIEYAYNVYAFDPTPDGLYQSIASMKLAYKFGLNVKFFSKEYDGEQYTILKQAARLSKKDIEAVLLQLIDVEIPLVMRDYMEVAKEPRSVESAIDKGIANGYLHFKILQFVIWGEVYLLPEV